MYFDRVGGEGGFLENTIRINLPKGLPLGFGEICGETEIFGGVPQKFLFFSYFFFYYPLHLHVNSRSIASELGGSP